MYEQGRRIKLAMIIKPCDWIVTGYTGPAKYSPFQVWVFKGTFYRAKEKFPIDISIML